MRRGVILAVLAILAVFVVACGATENNNNENTNNNVGNNEVSNGENTTNEEPEETTLTITHELGETEVDKNPEKVVVFDFGALDTLDKLGIDVVGVAQGNIPSYLEKYESDEYENIGSLKEPDFEKIAEIDPDIILISGRQSDSYDELQKLGPTVYVGVDTTRYMDSFKENITLIGEIFGKEAEVQTELAEIEESITTLDETATSSDKNALIILANDDKISAYGPSSRFGIIHDVFGVPAVDEGIEASTHGQNVTFEYVMEQDPDLLYVIDRTAAIGDGSAAAIVENQLVENTKAYQNDDIYYLDADFWYLSGGGLISVSEMVKEITESLE